MEYLIHGTLTLNFLMELVNFEVKNMIEIGSLDLDTRFEYLIVYKDKRYDTINTWTLGCAFELNYKEMLQSDYVEILGVYQKLTDSQLKNITSNIYKEFEYNCVQKGLTEIFKTQSQATYFFMRKTFEEKKIKFLGIGDDWNGKYEIRFSIH